MIYWKRGLQVLVSHFKNRLSDLFLTKNKIFSKKINKMFFL